jgi:hypothetical protein
MTKQQDVSVFYTRSIANAAIAKGLRTENLHDHPIGVRMRCIDEYLLAVLLHEAQDSIDPN